MKKPEFRLPTVNDRLTIAGMTGTGKTVFGAWVLSNMPFDKMPWIVLDFKRERIFNNIENIRELSLKDKFPKDGLHIIKVRHDEKEALESWLWRVHEHEKVGIYVDEGYEMPDKGAFRAILTQGRSLRIPVITLTQRPVDITRFVFTEAQFISAFYLTHPDDIKTVSGFMGMNARDYAKEQNKMPEYWSRYYDKKNRLTFLVKPVPNEAEILDRFDDRLIPIRRVI